MATLNFTKVNNNYISDVIIPGEKGLTTVHFQFHSTSGNTIIIQHTIDETAGWEEFPQENANDVFETTISGAVPGQKIRISLSCEPKVASYQVF